MCKEQQYMTVLAANKSIGLKNPVYLNYLEFESQLHTGQMVILSARELSPAVEISEPCEFFQVEEIATSPDRSYFEERTILILGPVNKKRRDKAIKNLAQAERVSR
ncbi:MAG TPA: hypothetical protein PLR75_01390 [Candidatus Pacearchaeota archaeon]|nr:hypothetical protein [Candidatus Pacearchaeota archaeon]